MLCSRTDKISAKFLQIFGFDCCQIDTDDAVADVLIQRYGWVFLQVSIFPAKVVQTCLLVPDQVSATALILVDQLHRVTRLPQRIPLCVLPEDLFQLFHPRLLSFRMAA